MQEDLGVGVRGKAPPALFQLFAQLAVVIDLAVENDLIPAIGAGHRLSSGLREVDDGQPAVSQADAAIVGKPGAGTVGTARAHPVANPHQLIAIDRRGA